MHVTRSGRPLARVLAGVGVAAVTATLLVAVGRVAQADPPPNPSDGQIHSAQQQKQALADKVGQLSAQVASMQTQLQQLQAAQEMAEQKVALTVSKLAEARTAADTAQQSVRAAQHKVTDARQQLRAYAQAAYMSGSIGGTTGSLLTAPDPSALLQQSALEGYESTHQLDAIGRLQTATVAKSNADAAARLAVQRRVKAKAAADQAEREASAAVLAARAEAARLRTTLAGSRTELRNAQEHLATLNHQRAAYIAYQKKQAEIRRQKRLARERAIARAKKIAAERARRERERARERRQHEHHHHHGGHGSSGGNGGGHHGSGQPSGGGWSSSRGWTAVHRAMRYLGWRYAWAGGNSNGPTYGVCAGDGAWNDCHIRGFDCSGLTLYAWAPYISLDHYSSTQYYQAGSMHPSTSQLRAGDLVFWSSNGTVGGIHHVAMYIGNGNVIQAPQSGDVIRITPLWDVDWGYFGATRPLT